MPDAIPEVCMRHRGNCPPGSHQRQARVELDQHRGSARERGYDSRWDKAREAWISKHPLCVGLAPRRGHIAPVKVLDHVRPHKGDKALFWCTANWQGLCVDCDNAKKPRESGIAPCGEHGSATAEIVGERVCRDCGRAA